MDIILSFLNLDPRPASEKIELLNSLKNEWFQIYNEKEPFRTFNLNDEKQCERVWAEISKHSNFSEFIRPVNNKERIYGIYAAYDLWDQDSEIKKRFLLRITKNEYQKRTRENQGEKLILNTFISKKAKEKLLELARDKNLPISKIIEDLILNE